MSYRFNSSTVKEDSKEAKLKCRLDGFDPANGTHSAFAKVTDDVLIVQANMGEKKHELKIREIGVSNEAVSLKPQKGEINVVIKKPSKDYSLASKMPK